MVALPKVQYEEQSDVQLAALIAGRDSAAAGFVVRANNQRLFRVAASIMKTRPDAEDVVQSSYLNAFAAISRFDGRSSLSTWLTRIVINEALGRLRSAKRRRAQLEGRSVVVIEEYREKLMRGSMHATAPDAEIATAELRTILERAITSIPDDFRTVFVLRDVENVSVEETAQLLGIPAATVKTRAYRARKHLQKTLDPEIRSMLTGTFPFAGDACAALTTRVIASFEMTSFANKGEQDHD